MFQKFGGRYETFRFDFSYDDDFDIISIIRNEGLDSMFTDCKVYGCVFEFAFNELRCFGKTGNRHRRIFWGGCMATETALSGDQKTRELR